MIKIISPQRQKHKFKLKVLVILINVLVLSDSIKPEKMFSKSKSKMVVPQTSQTPPPVPHHYQSIQNDWFTLKNIDIHDINTKSKQDQVIDNFFFNFLTILRQIFLNGSVQAGYRSDSPIYKTLDDPIQDDQVLTLLTQATSGNLNMTDFYKWPDMAKSEKFLKELFSQFEINRQKYQDFLKSYKNKVSQSSSILDWFNKNQDKENQYKRKIIMHLETFILAMLKRLQFRTMMEDKSLYDPMVKSHQTVTELKTIWQEASHATVFDTSAVDDLKKQVDESFKMLRKAAKAWNFISHFIYDPKVDENRFHLQLKYQFANELQSDLIALNTVIDGMETQVKLKLVYSMLELQFMHTQVGEALEE